MIERGSGIRDCTNGNLHHAPGPHNPRFPQSPTTTPNPIPIFPSPPLPPLDFHIGSLPDIALPHLLIPHLQPTRVLSLHIRLADRGRGLTIPSPTSSPAPTSYVALPDPVSVRVTSFIWTIDLPSWPSENYQVQRSERGDASSNDHGPTFVDVPDPQCHCLPSDVGAGVERLKFKGFDAGADSGEDAEAEEAAEEDLFGEGHLELGYYGDR